MASTSAPTATPPTATPTTAGPTTASPPEATPPKTIVIKLGTSSILSEHTHQPKLSILSSLVETCHALRTAGHRVVLVCSGAIGMGRVRMGMMAPSSSAAAAGSSASKAPELGERQALAALGQLRLIALWDSLFGQLGISVAQVLLTRNDIADRPRYLNARTTLHTLLSPRFDAIPIVNENDTVSVSELRFGDNDTLSAITAGLVEADYLFLLTDVDGLYTGNPRREPGARRLGVVRSVAEARRAVEVQTMGSRFGTGGMQTKLIAADLATAAGVATVIINGSHPENIIRVVAASLPGSGTGQGQSMNKGQESDTGAATGSAHEDLASSTSSLQQISKDDIGHPALEDPPHTLFLPTPEPLTARKWSILHALHPAGTLIIDEGAYSRIRTRDSGGRLLPAGVVGVEGTRRPTAATTSSTSSLRRAL
ncbi:glutamate 5-kinase [Acaromyces ingoldii]|uniref:Glutamate 5-kinase n=1 Tax=Acaromyces ingoldii TaxID=215250 RepID=A0A316YLM5_9BASI|nr:glutamate 5-kinase [Acaromyces ingoldii]PWN89704.1 glutamate 5-kinase [Acaromyces ingoldii]